MAKSQRMVSVWCCTKSSSFLSLPDDYADQMHGRFIQTVKKVPQRCPLILHIAQDEAKGDADHY